MAKKKDLCRSSNGIFVRNLGWKVSTEGKYLQHKFYLGRDDSAAKLASLRLERLWEQVTRRWQERGSESLYPTDRAVWDEVTLTIAEAVRLGKSEVRVPLQNPESAMIPESPFIGHWLDQLQKDITVIKISLQDPTAQEHSEEQFRREGSRLVELGRRLLRKNATEDTLFAAMDAFGVWAIKKYVDLDKQPTQYGASHLRKIAFLKGHLPDFPLSDLDASRIESLIETIRARPAGKRGKPISVAWTQNCLKLLRSFLRWLNRSPEFSWKRPFDLELTPVRVPLTSGEKTGVMRSAQVQTYTAEELKLLWKYATPFQRLLILLALNCGFGRGEIASLELADVQLRSSHPHAREVGHKGSAADSWIFRMRQKTGVYGEFKLWPETVSAIDWWLGERKTIELASGVSTLLVNRNGRRYDALTKSRHPNYQIANRWRELTQRVRADHPLFRSLSFNKLRKTAGNFVRSESHGEVAAVFLCHGTPVKSDELLDLYTNRPFGKVFEAIDHVGARLRPLWSEVASPFRRRRETITTMSVTTIRRVKSMKEQGFKTTGIAAALDLSKEAVHFALRQPSSQSDTMQPKISSNEKG
jgi:integrase